MINAQTTRKLSFFIAVASFVFTIVLAFVQFMLPDLTTVGAQATYYLYTVLIEVTSYLFVGVLALLFSVMWHDDEHIAMKLLLQLSRKKPKRQQLKSTSFS